MEDYRHRPRKNTPHVVKVYSAESGRYIGRIVDITADGMMIVSKDPQPVAVVVNFRILLPVMVRNRTDVVVAARIVWCKPDTNPAYYKVGCQFINLPGEDGFLLEDVMHKLNLVG